MGGASGKDDKIVPGETDPFPIMMDIDEAYLKNGNKGLIKKMREKMPKTNWEFDIEFTKLSDDVIPISNIDQLLNKQSNVFFTAACRTVKIKFGENADLLKNKSFTFLITDPHFVSTVKIPTKGSIKMRSTCGVDVTNDKATTDSSLQVIETVLTQGKSIDDALKLEKASTKSTK